MDTWSTDGGPLLRGYESLGTWCLLEQQWQAFEGHTSLSLVYLSAYSPHGVKKQQVFLSEWYCWLFGLTFHLLRHHQVSHSLEIPPAPSFFFNPTVNKNNNHILNMCMCHRKTERQIMADCEGQFWRLLSFSEPLKWCIE